MKLTKRYYLECAHQLSGLRPNHKCMRLHGHNYMFDLTVVPKVKAEKAGEDFEVMKNGMVVDVAELDVIVAPIFARIDHTFLNESLNDGTPAGKVAAAQPTAENIATYLWERLKLLRNDPRFSLVNVRVYENNDMWVDVGVDSGDAR
jgi:6-pyruvoyltetrahydropterin/6-carboxytetrahydropterin synthase